MSEPVRPPDPDIPAPLASLKKAHSLKPRNIDQLLQQSGLPDLETLAQSPFLQEYLGAISTIEASPVSQMLQGEALHHAALIEVRQKRQAAEVVAQTVEAGRTETADATEAALSGTGG